MHNNGSTKSPSGLSAVFVGGRSLIIRCMEHFLKQGNTIIAVVSDDDKVVQWARRHELEVFQEIQMLVDVQPKLEFDFLFSIVHLHRIADNVLELPNKAAINFHDGPLPKYAGLNVPCWALINGEQEHGVTWHLMDSKLDSGDILNERSFPIADHETAFSLNAKCFEHAYETFREVCGDLETGLVLSKRQNEGKRQYFSRYQRPESVAVIDWNQPAGKIVNLIHGLDFGRYDNPFTCAKAILAGQPLILNSAVSMEDRDANNHSPGQIIDCDEQSIIVATGSSPIRIAKLADLYGNDLGAQVFRSQLEAKDRVQMESFSSEERQKLIALDQIVIQHEAFWKNEFLHLTPIQLPLLEREDSHSSGQRVNERFQFDGELETHGFRGAESKRDFLFSAIAAFLCRVSNQQQFSLSLGVTLPDPLTRCFYSDRIPVHVRLDSNQNFRDFHRVFSNQVRTTVDRKSFALDMASRFSNVRDSIREWMDVPQMVHINRSDSDAAEVGGRLNITITDCGSLATSYRTDDLCSTAVARFWDGFGVFLKSILNSEQPIEALPILSPHEIDLQLNQFNDTTHRMGSIKTISEVFESQVAATPNQTALIFRDRKLTYHELDHLANRIAAALLNKGVQPQSIVGVMTDRNVEMLASLLAIWKIGAAYLPLDAEYPADRLEFMIRDSGTSVVVGESHSINKMSASDCKFLSVESLVEQNVDELPELAISRKPDDLAYVIYTSGSTGQPKGVMVEHQNVYNFFAGMDESINAPSRMVWLAATSIAFDISVLELFFPICRGGQVVLSDGIIAGRVQSGSTKKLNSERNDSSSNHAFNSGALDFGLYFFAKDRSTARHNKYDLLLKCAQFADEHGFSSIWTPERHFHDFGGAYPNPSVISAAIATVTDRIRICAGSCVLPLHDPIRIAEEWSVVDNLSDGRAAISFATGWQSDDFALSPSRYQTRHADFLSGIAQVQSLWSGKPSKRESPVGPIEIVTRPRPIQDRLPVWITAAGNPSTFELAGEFGANVLTHLLGQSIDELEEKINIYRQAWMSAGHAGRGVVTLMLHTFVSNDKDYVREQVRQPLTEYLRSATNLVKKQASSFPAFKNIRHEHVDAAFASLGEADLDAILEHAFERYFETSGLFGTPESCQSLLEDLQRCDVNEVSCLVDFGIEPEIVLKNLTYLDELKSQHKAQSPKQDLALSNGSKDQHTFEHLILKNRITHFQCTPSMARILLEDSEASAALRSIPSWLIGGEPMTDQLWDQVRASYNGRVTNMYGPTETTIWSSTQEMDRGSSQISIGKPILNTQFYVVDRKDQLLPTGTVGELLIGGHGVVRGYLNRPDLTASRFISNPFLVGGRLYRTGDLVKWNQDGTLSFVGRTDSQIKIRGHRIELGEIESRLSSLEPVRQGIVAVSQQSETERLIAYVTLEANSSLDLIEMKKSLSTTLPDFMIPAQLVILSEFPLTPNRKIDRNKLPTPEVLRPEISVDFVEPQTETEWDLAQIFCDVLGIKKVGINDSFLDLGGDSLSAVDAFVRIQRKFNLNLPLFEFLESPTIAGITQKLDRRIAHSGHQQSDIEQLIELTMEQ